MPNYYQILGVSKNADRKQIRSAFRKLARQYHPDLNPGNDNAEVKFKEINEAYEVLSDDDNRTKYDKYGDNWKHADQIESRFGTGGSVFGRTYRAGAHSSSGPFSGFEDLLGGGRRRAARVGKLETAVEIELQEAYSGAERYVTISTDGNNRRIAVSIPPGVDSGSVVRITPGDGQELLLNVTVKPHERITRKGTSLSTEVDVPLEDVILGGEVDVQTMDKKVRVKIPPESQNGQRIRLKGQGMPKLGSKDSRGDLYVVVRPKMPKDITDEQRELIERFKSIRS